MNLYRITPAPDFTGNDQPTRDTKEAYFIPARDAAAALRAAFDHVFGPSVLDGHKSWQVSLVPGAYLGEPW